MRITKRDAWYVIERGSAGRKTYFVIFVDYDRDSWTKRADRAARFISTRSASRVSKELRRRACERRKVRVAVSGG